MTDPALTEPDDPYESKRYPDVHPVAYIGFLLVVIVALFLVGFALGGGFR